MRLSKEDVAKNRQAIVDAAARLFRERGYDAVGLNELMAEAGFTHGGFYNHFESKEALAAEVCRRTFDEYGGWMTKGLAELVRLGDEDPLGRKLAEYLGAKHRDDMANGCPSAAFAACSAMHGTDVQAAFAKGIEDYISTFAAELEPAHVHDANARRQIATALLSQIVGAIVLSRAVVKAAPEMSDDVLEASRAAVGWLRAATPKRASSRRRSNRSVTGR